MGFGVRLPSVPQHVGGALESGHSPVCVCGGGSTCGLVLITVGILSSESGCLVGGSLGPHSGVFSIVLCAQNIPVLATA